MVQGNRSCYSQLMDVQYKGVQGNCSWYAQLLEIEYKVTLLGRYFIVSFERGKLFHLQMMKRTTTSNGCVFYNVMDFLFSLT